MKLKFSDLISPAGTIGLFSMQTLNQYALAVYVGLPFIFNLIYGYLLYQKLKLIALISIFHFLSGR